MTSAFDAHIEETDETLTGPLRSPRQMLHDQTYDDHASIHDDATAQKLGFKAAAIEGPTHFSQFVPLGAKIWGERFFAEGCISAHYRNPVFEGEKVRASAVKPASGINITAIEMHKEDGTEVLKGSMSVGGGVTTALESRMFGLADPGPLVILHDVKKGMKSGRLKAVMDFATHMGAMYPFTLNDKLKAITENSSWYASDKNPWDRAIIPMEMISVLIGSVALGHYLPMRGPAVGLFADQEIRLINGPLFVGQPYEVEQEVVALSASKRTESMWLRTLVFEEGGSEPVASMLLNNASFKDSYANYEKELAEITG